MERPLPAIAGGRMAGVPTREKRLSLSASRRTNEAGCPLELKDKLNIFNDRYKQQSGPHTVSRTGKKNASKTPIIAPPPKLSKQPGTLSKVFTEIAKVTSRSRSRLGVCPSPRDCRSLGD